jgi:aspartate kinase
MSLVVQKYGGSSVASLEHIKRVASHIMATKISGHNLVVTISAMGQQTDDLVGMAHQLSARPPQREMDMLLTAGERVSMALLSIALNELQIGSVSLTGSQCGILTDGNHGNARVTKILGDRIRDNISQGKVVIVAGFQGVSPVTREVTTLGRGGSDLSAIALAATLGAEKCQLYKDVPGIMTADPRFVPSAKKLDHVTWATLNLLAWSGANVLHTRGAHLAQKFGVPFEVRSSLDFTKTGTMVEGVSKMETPQVTALANKNSQTLIEFKIEGEGAARIASRGLSWLWERGESPFCNAQYQTAPGSSGMTQIISESLAKEYVDVLAEFAVQEKGKCVVGKRVDGLACITVAGEGFQQSPEIFAQITETLTSTPVFMDTRNTSVSICIKQEEAAEVTKKLHQKLIEQ